MLAGVLVIAVVLPFVFQGFVVFQLTQVMIYGLAILGLNLLTGFNGQFSVGHGAFYGLGAYVTAILMHRYGVAYYWTLPAAGGVCFVVGTPVRVAGACGCKASISRSSPLRRRWHCRSS